MLRVLPLAYYPTWPTAGCRCPVGAAVGWSLAVCMTTRQRQRPEAAPGGGMLALHREGVVPPASFTV